MRDDRPIRRLSAGLRRLAQTARRALRAAWIAARSSDPGPAAPAPPIEWHEERRRLLDALHLERQDLARAAAGLEGFRRHVALLEADLAERDDKLAALAAAAGQGDGGAHAMLLADRDRALAESQAEATALRDLVEQARTTALKAQTREIDQSIRLMQAALALAPRGSAGAMARRRLAALYIAEGLIDPDWYRAAYPDVQGAGLDAAVHFLDHGLADGRPPRLAHGLAAPSAPSAERDLLLRELAGAFPGLWPWRKAARQQLVRALERAGMFDPAAYRAANPDVAAAGLDPGLHFLEHGLREGRPVRGPAASRGV